MQPTSTPRRDPHAAGPCLYFAAITLFLTVTALFPSLAYADDGFATWYGPGFQGNTMANGQTYDMYDPTTAACNILPFGTWVQVTNPANGRSVVVQVRDRGGFSYALDLSYAAFKMIANPAIMGTSIRYQVVSGPSGVPVPVKLASSTKAPPSTKYVVQPGDNLSSIALQMGVDATSLAAWNAISDSNLLTVGQTLRLSAPPAPLPAAPPAATRTYVVQAGDTILGIASQFGVSSDVLSSLNGITDPGSIQIGQTLNIPATGQSQVQQTYVVQPGDTLSGIAQYLGASQESIITANHLSDPNSISQGMSLTIPSH